MVYSRTQVEGTDYTYDTSGVMAKEHETAEDLNALVQRQHLSIFITFYRPGLVIHSSLISMKWGSIIFHKMRQRIFGNNIMVTSYCLGLCLVSFSCMWEILFENLFIDII